MNPEEQARAIWTRLGVDAKRQEEMFLEIFGSPAIPPAQPPEVINLPDRSAES